MMKPIRFIYTILLLSVLFLTGCENKWPDNGDFDGMWQLMSIERDGKVTSLKDTKHYWSVRTNLVQFTEYGIADRMYAHFERRDGRLVLTDFCYESENATASDNDEWIPLEECDILNPWGIFPTQDSSHPERVTETFTIDHLDGDCLILSTTDYRLEFRKF